MTNACLEDITSSQTNIVETTMPTIVEGIQPAVETTRVVPARLCYKGHSCENSYNKQTEILDIVESDSLYYINGVNLKPAHKKMIQPGDVWKIALIEDIPSCCREHIGDAFFVLGFGRYMGLQKKIWLAELAKQYEAREGKPPTNTELVAEMDKHKVGEKYKLCYILSFPRQVKFNSEKYSKNRDSRDCADWFLGASEMLSGKIFPQPFPYFEIINENSTVAQLGEDTPKE